MGGSFEEALLYQFHIPEKQYIVQFEEVEQGYHNILNSGTKWKQG